MNKTRYQYCGSLLGTFEFTGTKEEFAELLSRLQNDPVDGENYDGEILSSYSREQKLETLIYHDEVVAIEYKNPAAVALGKLGGSVKSKRKSKSSADNGRLGGRPKQKGNDAH